VVDVEGELNAGVSHSPVAKETTGIVYEDVKPIRLCTNCFCHLPDGVNIGEISSNELRINVQFQ
jgi:hypothetical protein